MVTNYLQIDNVKENRAGTRSIGNDNGFLALPIDRIPYNDGVELKMK